MISDETIAERMLTIAKAALAKTASGETKWSQTDDEDAFALSGPKTSLVIDAYRLTYELRLFNSRGVVVATLKRSPTDAEDWNPDEIYVTLKDLHGVARRSALDIDGTLAAALEDLAGTDEPPF